MEGRKADTNSPNPTRDECLH